LTALDAERLLCEYAIAVPRTIRVGTPGEAEAAQAKLGCKVVVKVAAAIHKSEVGGVRLGATTPSAAAGAVLAIRADLASAGRRDVGDEFLVQEQIESGLEMIVGVNRDPVLGPLVMVGLGGALVELLGDVAVRLAPLTYNDITDMVQSLRSYPLLTGYRGEQSLDVGALHQVLHGVSALVEDVPEIEEMDLNPVLVLDKGAVAVDVRIRVGRAC
jgi:acetyltransferase